MIVACEKNKKFYNAAGLQILLSLRGGWSFDILYFKIGAYL